jgi:hypothetical protein
MAIPESMGAIAGQHSLDDRAEACSLGRPGDRRGDHADLGRISPGRGIP